MQDTLFKQAAFFLLNPDNSPSASTLCESLGEHTFKPCDSTQIVSTGFVNPFEFGADLIFNTQNASRAALRVEKKVLPAQVIKAILTERIKKIWIDEGRVVGREEKQRLKEDVISNLLPKAFSTTSQIDAIFDDTRNLLIVNQASEKQSDLMVDSLRDALGELEAKFPVTQDSLSQMMSGWILDGEAPGCFELADFCEFKRVGGEPITRVFRQDLTSENIVNLVRSGMTVTRLGLIWDDCIEFILSSDWTMRQIKYITESDEFHNNKDCSKDTEAGQYYASVVQTQMLDWLGTIFEELVEFAGGYEEYL